VERPPSSPRHCRTVLDLKMKLNRGRATCKTSESSLPVPNDPLLSLERGKIRSGCRLSARPRPSPLDKSAAPGSRSRTSKNETVSFGLCDGRRGRGETAHYALAVGLTRKGPGYGPRDPPKSLAKTRRAAPLFLRCGKLGLI